MTDKQIPQWLTDAVEAHRNDPPVVRTGPSRAPGSIVLVRPPGGGLGRYAVVSRDYDRYLEILLTHSYPEMATDQDVVFRHPQTGVPWPVVVEADLAGQVWPDQVTHTVGQIDPALLPGLRWLLWEEGREAWGIEGRGTWLRGPMDPRWRFKEEELGELLEIVMDCRSTLLREFWGDE